MSWERPGSREGIPNISRHECVINTIAGALIIGGGVFSLLYHRQTLRNLLEAAGKGTRMAAHFSPSFRSRLSLFSDLLRTVLAVKGSLRRAQQRRPLDRSGPF